MPPGRSEPHAEHRERALAEALAAVGAELRLVDVADYVAYIRNDQLASLQDIVNSSVELYFKPGTLTFAWAADLELDWDTPPKIVLGMEFRHREVWIVFDLILRADETSVTIKHLAFSGAEGTEASETDRLIEVIEDAQIRGRRHPGLS